ncbi:MAG: CoA-binding protein [Flavobacteriales bacterium CG_4_10_14_0_2_um_filter_32_8]|nr:MAG: CoA-binding protein [Bacteroidetes bacterium CG2_30_32_10]PJA09754.1 MAG: CoA-binding protein [Flavobacteriales bacterium CG_4_10_14_0_2_um_filter_32_8]PJB14371.1 MAG: CoA-binding protein [Flavobacteriales bacterium CG_4_9_14_3_um_filter_32_8]
MKKTIILGASSNPERYAYKATVKLANHGHEVFPIGLKAGTIEGHEILLNNPIIKDVDTVTLYVGQKNQPPYYDYILNQIKPKRIIFNPGAENAELEKMAQEKGIETEVACTLVLLSLGNY